MAASCVAMATFIAMSCITVNTSYILCKEDRAAGQETSISPRDVKALVPIEFYDVKELSSGSAAFFLYGDGKTQAPIRSAVKMSGCEVRTSSGVFYFEFPCKEFRKLLQ